MSSPLDVSGTEKPRQIQENLMAYMRLFAGLPGVTLYDAASFWLVSNTSAPGNMILRTRFEASCTEEQIDAMLERIGQYSDQIDWLIFPGDQPADLGKRLEARGMPGGPGGNWLWTDLTRLRAHPTMPDHFRVEQVRDFSDALRVDSRLGGGLWLSTGALLPSLYAAWVWAGCLFVALHRVCG
jgi:hypothetical protein